MKGGDLATLLLLGAIWGASFLFIRVAVPALGPLVLADLRVLLAAAALVLYAAAVRRVPPFRGLWRRLLTLGTLNAAVPFTLIAAAEIHLTSSLAAVLNATTPLFAAAVAAVWLEEPITLETAAGLVLGVAGVAVLVGFSPLPATGAVLLSVGASLAAAFFYAVGSAYATRTLSGVPPLVLATGQQLAAGLLLAPFAAAGLPPSWPPLVAVLATLGLALLSTSVAYLLYFRLLARVGPTRTLTVTFLVPAFGLLWGALLLGEPMSGGMLPGLGMILAGIVLVTGVASRGRRRAMRPPHEGAAAPAGPTPDRAP